jgi:hypothetical protein
MKTPSSAASPHVVNATADGLPTPWQRLLALSGVVFAVLFVVGSIGRRDRADALGPVVFLLGVV